MMTVFINGVPTEVPRGPLDMKAMFGTQDFLLVHSSGVPLPINEFGFLAHSLQPGESYFLVSLSLSLSLHMSQNYIVISINYIYIYIYNAF